MYLVLISTKELYIIKVHVHVSCVNFNQGTLHYKGTCILCKFQPRNSTLLRYRYLYLVLISTKELYIIKVSCVNFNQETLHY
jgi:hypothetical protein